MVKGWSTLKRVCSHSIYLGHTYLCCIVEVSKLSLPAGEYVGGADGEAKLKAKHSKLAQRAVAHRVASTLAHVVQEARTCTQHGILEQVNKWLLHFTTIELTQTHTHTHHTHRQSHTHTRTHTANSHTVY